MSKSILVTGATGKQGGSVIRALADNTGFTLLAVTRNASSESAQRLKSKGKNVIVIEGDQNDAPALFAKAKEVAKNELWGVYSVQLSQGTGVTHEGEIKQGKDMVDEAVKAGVKHFVYSSVERGGDEKSWTNPTPIEHFSSKYEIENHLKASAGTMGWTILRPTAFMDNLEPNFQTQVFMATMRDTLGTKPCQWIAVRDIGVFVKMAFEDPAKFNHKALGLAGEELNTEQIDQIFKSKTTQGMAGTYGFFGSLLKFAIADLGRMINWFATDGYGVNIPELKKIYPGLTDFPTWIVEESKFEKK